LRSDDERSLFDDEAEGALPPTPPAVGGVRITGATPAGDDPLDDWNLEPEQPATEMPHWTDEPTGQVPAVLSRDEEGGEADPWAAVQAPTWREESSDWKAEESSFDAGLLSDDDPLGALNPTPVLEESQPWEFDIDPPTEAIPVVPPSEPVVEGPLRGVVDPTVDEPVAVIPAPRRRRGGAPTEAEEESADRQPRPRSRRPDRGDRPARSLRPPRPETDDVGDESPGRNMPVAVGTGVLIALLVLVTFNIGTVLAMALVTVVVALAAAEAYAAFRRGGQHPATLLGLVATLSLLIATYNRGPQALGLVTVLLFAFTTLWFMVGVERADVLKGIGSTLLVYLWIGVFGSYAALLLNPNLFPNRHGLAFLLGAILVSVIYDVAALFVGSAIGRRPLAREISPHKTWEGLIGGTVAALLMSVIIVQMIHPWTLSSAFALGIVVSIVAPLGDLSESLIKRHIGIKDMGKLLPGHGGMLDRVDGLLFVLPATYYLVRAFHLG